MDRYKEYILCAAIHYDNGKVYDHQPKNIKQGVVICGRRHHNCFATLAALAGMEAHIGKCGRGETQGFVTSLDRYVARPEAYVIARAAGQLLIDLGSDHENGLISENLYNDAEDLYSEDLY